MASLSGQVDWSVGLSMLVWGLGCLWVYNEFSASMVKKHELPSLHWIHKLELIFVFVLAFSIFPSPAKLLTMYRVIQVSCIVLFSGLWVSKFGFDITLRYLTLSIVILVSAIVWAALFAPQLVYVGNRMRGDYIANAGAVSVLACVLILGSERGVKRKGSVIVLFTTSVIILALSRTRTAYAAAFSVVLLALIRYPKSPRIQRVNLLLGALLPLLLISQRLPLVESWVVRDETSISTLSDRVPLWQYALQYTLDTSPWIGVGFYANRAVLRSYNVGLGTTHSAFTEILTGGGILSFSLFLLVFVLTLRLAVKLFLSYGAQPEVFTVVSLLLCVTAFGFVSEEMIIASPISFTFWVSVALLAQLHQQRYSTNPTKPFRLSYQSNEP